MRAKAEIRTFWMPRARCAFLVLPRHLSERWLGLRHTESLYALTKKEKKKKRNKEKNKKERKKGEKQRNEKQTYLHISIPSRRKPVDVQIFLLLNLDVQVFLFFVSLFFRFFLELNWDVQIVPAQPSYRYPPLPFTPDCLHTTYAQNPNEKNINNLNPNETLVVNASFCSKTLKFERENCVK